MGRAMIDLRPGVGLPDSECCECIQQVVSMLGFRERFFCDVDPDGSLAMGLASAHGLRLATASCRFPRKRYSPEKFVREIRDRVVRLRGELGTKVSMLERGDGARQLG